MARAGRVGLVREALGIAAYHVEKYDEAVRELRTHRRISGSNENIALIADAERGRGKPEKALELLEWSKEAELDNDTRTELVIVAAGAKSDLGDIDAARRLIEAEDFTQRPSGALVRLMAAYAEVLRLHGETELADKYEELSRRTAKATGTLFGDEEPDPNFGVEIETIEEIPDEELEGEAPAETGGQGDDADAAPEDDLEAAETDSSESVGVPTGAVSDSAPDDDADSGDVAKSGDAERADESAASATSGAEDDSNAPADGSATDASSEEAAADQAAAEDSAAAPAKSAKTHVSEKELKKVKVSEDEIEAELDEILAEADADSDDDSDAAPAAGTADTADATDTDASDADTADADAAPSADAAEDPNGSDQANGDR